MGWRVPPPAQQGKPLQDQGKRLGAGRRRQTSAAMNKPFLPLTQQPAMIDPFGRHVTYLRVSVTDRCDFRCTYCMAEHMTFLPKKDLLSLEELDRVCSAFVAKGVRKLRITGGEPLVRKNIMWLF